MKKWLIVLALAAAMAPGFAAAATQPPEEPPLWKRLLAAIVPSVPAAKQPAATERHRHHGRARLAAHDARENAPPPPRVASQRQDREHVGMHVGSMRPGAVENLGPLPRGAPQLRDHNEHAGVAATGAEEEPASPPDPAPAPANLQVRNSSAARGNECSGGQRVMSAYYWEGRRTASGEPFNPNGMTAAHRTLPFGTRVTVINPRTGRSVTVVVNDRGPFVRGVSIDLSLGAAKAIGMRGTGTVCIL